MSCNSSKTRHNQNIQVYVRVRPTNDRERAIRSYEVIDVPSNRDVIAKTSLDSKLTKKFTFDRTFGPNSKQCSVYENVVAPLIEEVLSGYNCTVFAYGQTGTGKTHTMIGEEIPSIGSSWEDDTNLGIIPRALSHLFDELRLMEVEFSMRISFLELYNEELFDLLSTQDATQIRIFDDANKKGSIIVQGLEEIPVHSTADVYKLLAKGQEKRKTASTMMNAMSSRSHTIFSILVHIKENGIDGEELLKIGKLNLVDLAGSENASKTGNEKGIRTRESVNINQSLLTLGRVITALVERAPHVPYRESKLTRLLQESLGGRTKTSIIATIAPGSKDIEETLNTLEYAHRAKNIQNKPEINQKLSKKTVLKAYTEEIDKLKRDLMAARDKNGIYLAEETYNDMQYRLEMQNRELSEKVLYIKALKDELGSKQRLFNEVSLNLVEKTEELFMTETDLANTRMELGKTKDVLHVTKKKYQEKKHLLKNHQKTEDLLTIQANQLLNVASIASKDTHLLHDSIDRRKQVDQKTQNICSTMVAVMQEKFNVLQQLVDDLRHKHNNEMQTINQDIFNNGIQCKTFSDNVLLNIKHLIESSEKSKIDVTTCVKNFRKIFDDLSIEQEETIKKTLNDIMYNQQSFRDQLTVEVNACDAAWKKQMEMISHHNFIVVEHINNGKSAIDAFQTEHLKSIKKLFTETIKCFEESAYRYQDSTSKTDHIEVKLEDTIAMLQSTLAEIKQNNASVKETTRNLEMFKETTENEQEEIIESIKKANETFQSSCDKLTNTVNQQTALVTETIENDLNCIQTSEMCIAENSKSLSKQIIDARTDIFERIKTNVNQQNKLLTNVEESESNQIDLISHKTQQLIDAITEECERQTYYNLECTSRNDLTDEIVVNHSHAVNEHLLLSGDILNKFLNKELKIYSSTGETPIKQDFIYPRTLAATSPHKNIINRFRQIHQERSSDLDSSTISELDESILDENDYSSNIATANICNSDLLETITPQTPLEPILDRQQMIKNKENVKPLVERRVSVDYFTSTMNNEKNSNTTTATATSIQKL